MTDKSADAEHAKQRLFKTIDHERYGMLGVTGFGLLFTPAFYTVVRKIGGKKATAEKPRAQEMMAAHT